MLSSSTSEGTDAPLFRSPSEDSEADDLENGLPPHNRSHALYRLGPSICCGLIAFTIIMWAVLFVILHPEFSKHTIQQERWILVAYSATTVVATVCCMLSVMSACFNYVPDDDSAMDKYVIQQKLGEGAFGAVYRATQKHGERTPVAFKFCKLGSQSELNAGIKEAAYQLGVKHKNIVECRDMFLYKKGCSFPGMILQRDTPYSLCFVMDLCDGDVSHEVKRWFKNKEQWPGYSGILHIFKETVAGVDYLHKKGLIHRDLKPENLFLSADHQHVKVGDLGISEMTSGQALDEGWGMAGTDGYIAPEIHRNQFYSTKADQWSLGCILFDLIRPTEDALGSLADYVCLKLEEMGKPCEELREEGDLWYEYGEHGKYEEVLAIAMQAPEVTNNATVQKSLQRCLVPDPHKRCRSDELLRTL